MQENSLHIDYELIGKYLSGDATEDEINMVETWRSKSASNEQEFEQLVLIWEESKPWYDAESPDVDINAAWDNVKKNIDRPKSDSQIKEPGFTIIKPLLYYGSRIAAVIILGFMIYSIYNSQFGVPEQKEFVAVNSVQETRLADDTRITLNENSKLSYPEKFINKKREVELTGEAFFEVKREEKKPFVIHVEKAQIEVLGTSFNVRALAEENDISVTVQEGKVKLADEEDIAFVILEPNEKGILNKETGNIEKYSRTDGSDMFWKTKTLIFRETRLETVFKTLERVFEIEITVDKEDILRCELTGKFQDVSIDEILENIALNFNLTILKENNTFKIEGDGC